MTLFYLQTYGWAQLLKYSKEFDDKMLKDWQDELANLLTFVCSTLATSKLRLITTIDWLVLRCRHRFCCSIASHVTRRHWAAHR